MRFREISEFQRLIRVPNAPAILAGLCHLGSEFVPVVLIDSLIGEHPTDSVVKATPSSKLLVLNGPIGAWAIVIDQALSVGAIKLTDRPSTDSCASPANGPGDRPAKFDGNQIQVLDTESLCDHVAGQLKDVWEAERIATRANDIPAIGNRNKD